MVKAKKVTMMRKMIRMKKRRSKKDKTLAIKSSNKFILILSKITYLPNRNKINKKIILKSSSSIQSM